MRISLRDRTQYSLRHTFDTDLFGKIPEDVRLQQMGGLSREMESYIATEARKEMDKVEAAVSKAYDRAGEADAALFQKASEKGAVSKASLKLVGVGSKTFDRYKDAMMTNCRKSMNLTNTKALQIGQKAFRDSVNTAWARVRTGVSDISDAVQDACHQLGGHRPSCDLQERQRQADLLPHRLIDQA